MSTSVQLHTRTFFTTPGQLPISPPGSTLEYNNLVAPMQSPKRLPLEDLRGYLRAVRVIRPTLLAGLPPVPRSRQQHIAPSDAFLLSVEPDSRFRLKRLGMLNQDEMNHEIANLVDKYIPKGAVIDVQNAKGHIRTANFNIPAPGFLVYAKPINLVTNVMTLAKHVSLMLETSERILNVIWPMHSQGHTFVMPTESNIVPAADNEICVPIYYTKVRERDLVDSKEPMVKMVVLVIPPWALAGADLYELVTTRTFPEFKLNSDGTRPKFTRAEKVLAQIYDCCTAKDCPFFAITTFTNWIFGSFSTASGWSTVILSPNISYADFNPTILECITFWTASALKVPGAFFTAQYPNSAIPEVGSYANLQMLAESRHPSRALSDEEWIKTCLDSQNENANAHITTQIAENTWMTTFPQIGDM